MDSARLFGCLFAAQSSLLVLTPILSEVATDFGVSPATAGQLRAMSGVVAALVAVGLVMSRRRWELRGLLELGLGLLTVAVSASVIAPSFAALAAAQIVLGAGVSLVLAGGLAAAGSWAPEGERATLLSWAMVGAPSAWIAGMPVIGFLGGHSWRLAWLVPLTASLVTLHAVSRRKRGLPEPAPTSVLRRSGVGRWASGELLAYGGWSGVLVWVGGLLTDAHGASPAATGVALGGGAIAYVVATFVARRWVARAARPMVLVAGSALALAALVLGAVRPSFGFSVLMWAVTAFCAGVRMMAGSAAGLDLAGVGPLQAMSVRAASMQAGYLVGAVLGGAGLALGGWTVVGVALAVPLLLAVGVTATDSEISARVKVGVR
ncbi:putative MFS family arabinose efflux permease [Kribbella steppae]|uniref:Putative MFS family arabinose efflux permease n=1 Tax=Kribbella steppae TaxID=2512223 RepID=A0A4R2HMR3_9ACTN|nr:MFS transporter [Kribbella steppae]TCO32474.1 putative MFS family arabinose efflux permease [Kribbella steppae]